MKKTVTLLAAAVLGVSTLMTSGCAVLRGQESVSSYADDTAITAAVKAKFVEDKSVDAGAISVETLRGTVQLSGFARSAAERSKAEMLARQCNGVVAVENRISVRP